MNKKKTTLLKIAKKWIYINEQKESKNKLVLLDKRFNSAVIMAKAPVVTKSTVIQLNDKIKERPK